MLNNFEKCWTSSFFLKKLNLYFEKCWNKNVEPTFSYIFNIFKIIKYFSKKSPVALFFSGAGSAGAPASPWRASWRRCSHTRQAGAGLGCRGWRRHGPRRGAARPVWRRRRGGQRHGEARPGAAAREMEGIDGGRPELERMACTVRVWARSNGYNYLHES